LPACRNPGVDAAALASHHAVLEPDFLDLPAGRLKVALQSYVLRCGGRLVVPAHFRGRRRAHVRRVGSGFEPLFGHRTA